MKISIINGPNLNLLGSREISIYGEKTFESYFEEIKSEFKEIDFDYFQSNIEGELIDEIHLRGKNSNGIILNAAAYTHTSIAIADAVSAIEIPVVEVHISNVFSRESFRHVSLLAPVCKGIISGFGLESYRLAVLSFISKPI